MANHRSGIGILARLVASVAVCAVLCWGADWASAQSENSSREKGQRKMIERARDEREAKALLQKRSQTGRAARPSQVAKPPPAAIKPSEIDSILGHELEKLGRELAPVASDEDFLRRVYLDLTGKPPTPDRLDEFIRADDALKRSSLIDELLSTEEYARHWARYWRDVIAYHALDRRALATSRKFEDWLTEQFQNNVHWNRIATELITAKGPTDEDGRTFLIFCQFDGAPENTAVNLAAEASRVFLGIQIQCAQCHDHPYDEWKREQFHEMAAFFARTNVRRQAQGVPRFEVVSTDDRASGRVAKTRRLPLEHQMPDKEDPNKKLTMHPQFLLGQRPDIGLADMTRRETFAQYVTDANDPWFARAYVNRIWSELMGEGFYEPVDDLGPGRQPRYPAVINQLASAWVASDYDVKWLFRLVMNTQAYQRETRSREPVADTAPFAAVCPTRLTGDQIFDSLVTALGISENTLAGGLRDYPQARRFGQFGPRAAFNAQFGIDPSIPIDDVQGTIPQALFMMNSGLVNSQIRAEGDTLLGRLISVYDNDDELIRLLYKRVLARAATEDERNACKQYIKEVDNRQEAFEDLLWALVNSTEFITKR